MSKVFTLTSIAILLWQSFTPNPVVAQQPIGKSFAQWCQSRNTVPAATKQTIDILIQKAGTKDCQQADTKLKKLSELYLSGEQISDLKPLASLTNLKALFLNDNHISDLQPLANLTSLKGLDLNANRISDIKPLARLTKLTDLRLSQNRINDVKPLARLANSLTDLYLQQNQIREQDCPVRRESCHFDL